MTVKTVHGDDERRFFAQVDASGGSGACHVFAGGDGYGKFSVNGKEVKAHIFAYELANGPVPEDLELDHLCRNPPCVNPSHLEPVPHRENILRGSGTKLSDEAAASLYGRWLSGGISQRALALEAGVATGTLRRRFKRLQEHPDCVKWRQAKADAALARKFGGAA